MEKQKPTPQQLKKDKLAEMLKKNLQRRKTPKKK